MQPTDRLHCSTLSSMYFRVIVSRGETFLVLSLKHIYILEAKLSVAAWVEWNQDSLQKTQTNLTFPSESFTK